MGFNSGFKGLKSDFLPLRKHRVFITNTKPQMLYREHRTEQTAHYYSERRLVRRNGAVIPRFRMEKYVRYDDYVNQYVVRQGLVLCSIVDHCHECNIKTNNLPTIALPCAGPCARSTTQHGPACRL